MQQSQLSFITNNKQLLEITEALSLELKTWQLPETGILNLFIPHTSASLLIQENADMTARQDLLNFFERLAPENQSWHRHVLEGPDDTTSHMRASLTSSSLNIPIVNGRLGLGIWQGIYLFEHRQGSHKRNIIITAW